MESIVTKRGDKGTTDLLYGGRVAKDDLHTEAYGALDEAISALGLARSLAKDDSLASEIEQLQRTLFTAGAELATDPAKRKAYLAHFEPVTESDITLLEDKIRLLENEVTLPDGFVIPGGSPVAASIDMARSIIRRVERWTVKLDAAQLLANPLLVAYFNRLSDYLFMLARAVEGNGAITAK